MHLVLDVEDGEEAIECLERINLALIKLRGKQHEELRKLTEGRVKRRNRNTTEGWVNGMSDALLTIEEAMDGPGIND